MATKIKVKPILIGAGIGLAGTALVSKMRGKKATGKQYMLFTALGALAGLVYGAMAKSNAAGTFSSTPILGSKGYNKNGDAGVYKRMKRTDGSNTCETRLVSPWVNSDCPN